MTVLAKPVLRGHLRKYIIKTFASMFVFSVINSSIYYFGYAKRRQDKTAEFFRTYDPEEHLKEMVKYGLMQSYQKKE